MIGLLLLQACEQHPQYTQANSEHQLNVAIVRGEQNFCVNITNLASLKSYLECLVTGATVSRNFVIHNFMGALKTIPQEDLSPEILSWKLIENAMDDVAHIIQYNIFTCAMKALNISVGDIFEENKEPKDIWQALIAAGIIRDDSDDFCDKKMDLKDVLDRLIQQEIIDPAQFNQLVDTSSRPQIKVYITNSIDDLFYDGDSEFEKSAISPLFAVNSSIDNVRATVCSFLNYAMQEQLGSKTIQWSSENCFYASMADDSMEHLLSRNEIKSLVCALLLNITNKNTTDSFELILPADFPTESARHAWMNGALATVAQ